jgi:hypothetical protein
MLTDALLNFVPIGGNLSCVGATGASFPSAVYDVLGAGAGVAPPNIIGNSALFGSDMGIGDNRPLLNVVVGTAFTTVDAATLEVALQGAPDSGVAGGYQPGTWQTLIQSALLTAAQLTAGAIIARFDFPPAFPANLRPRFYRLLFITPTGTQFTAGTIGSALVTMARDDDNNRFTPNNFVVN